ncbi:Clavaminate synthase-like protein [Dendrothele bispora CBS 962.96]|uniref:Clavaminate synthase-like protein n=1 Tax=Dendrothele bispora (strain CBS 962.96) TaxID=1314807 RepID=A0A4V4HGP8_DENBC|nr:Clavaminate synthase-like protein [Dendrothele bispora CBS 962.96]
MAEKDFQRIPILDYSSLKYPDKRRDFIAQLQHALLNVGFLYLSNSSIEMKVVEDLKSYIPRLFNLSKDEKDKVRMSNSPHFLGYSRLGSELTKGKVDYREQFDFGTPHVCQWRPGDSEYKRVWGPSQYPDEDAIPGFKDTFEAYLHQISELATELIRLMAEALGLSPESLSKFYDTKEKMQGLCKIVQYPISPNPSISQGVGPHYDSGFLTILLQASSHPGLQVQNLSNEWVDVPPIPGTFVVNFGRALEFVTNGLVRATSHRVISPPMGSTSPRYSVPYFHNISQDVWINSPQSRLDFPREILELKEIRGDLTRTDSINFSDYETDVSGDVYLNGRVKSHPDVAQKHYPERFKKFFPEGLPAQGMAY